MNLVSNPVVVSGSGLRYSTGSIFYPFHQQTDFYYLTGFNQPNACLLLEGDEYTMFVDPIDIENEVWDGPRTGLAGAKDVFGADHVSFVLI